MTEMVERVARAIIQARYAAGAAASAAENGRVIVSPKMWNEAISEARAAIAAMREPTEEQEKVMDVLLGPDTPATRRWHWVWQEMIDAALGGET